MSKTAWTGVAQLLISAITRVFKVFVTKHIVVLCDRISKTDTEEKK